MDAKTLYPDFDDLPKVEGQPKGCAWGIFDKDGVKDIYGTLNFITPETVKAAAAEVQHGISVSLNWSLNAIKFPFSHRQAPVHTPLVLGADLGMKGLLGFDDSLSFNTQYSSQWDSLCHVTHSHSGETYNGFVPTVEKLSGTSTAEHGSEGCLPTIDRWHARGGLVARGVLVDWKRYVEEVRGQKEWHPLDGYKVTVSDLEEAAKHFGVEFRSGDVLVVRTGLTSILESPTPEDFARMANSKMAGVEGSEETARWVWNKRFAAVAGDAIAFEALGGYSKETGIDLVLHRYFIILFGMSIGELWDLDALSEACKKTGKYSFLLTSAPLNHPGLVASPPNATAVL